MATITLPYTIANGDTSDATKLMDNFNEIVTEYNSEIGGKAGSIVSTTEVQTLTNKTLTAPKINEDVALTATATELNLLDGKTSLAINRAFTWYLDGTSIDGVGGPVYIAPQNMTVIKTQAILTSGTCTITLKKGATTIDTLNVTNSLTTDTTPTSAAITAGDLISLTLSSSSSPLGLKVTMECTFP